MKKIFFPILIIFFLSCTASVLAFDIPAKPKSFVNDYAGILQPNEINELENKLSNFEKNTTDEIAVVTIPSLDGDTIENVAQNIFTKWGIGKKDKNNGVLILIALAERKTRIHTGYGVEGSLTDLTSSYIQSDVMTPAFRNGDYFSGINGAVDKIIESLSGENIVPDGYQPNEGGGVKINFEFILMGIFFAFQFLVSVLGKSKSWWAGGVLGGVIGGIIWIFGSLSFVLSLILFVVMVFFGLGFDFIVSRAYQKAKISGRRSPWWFGGGFGGGSGGGGFGGFGGGMSGGGGSSGSW